jgi:predicted glycosyl hydrolase (DUF1957 family)
MQQRKNRAVVKKPGKPKSIEDARRMLTEIRARINGNIREMHEAQTQLMLMKSKKTSDLARKNTLEETIRAIQKNLQGWKKTENNLIEELRKPFPRGAK